MASRGLQEDALTKLSLEPLAPASNPNIYLYKPSIDPSPGCPKLIVLCPWLGGATASRIAVYCSAYQKLYPGTPILLIRTVMADITFKSAAQLRAQLAPARDFVLDLFRTGNSNAGSDRPVKPEHGALIHMFSHGGCNTAIQLSHALRSKRPDGGSRAFPIPLLGIILDSTPGTGGFAKSYPVATYSLPKAQPANAIGRVLLVPSIGLFTGLQYLRIISSVDDMRRELNDLETFGNAPRLYLHSKGDKVVAAADVASHAAELAGKGVQVRRELWETADHCALPVENAKRYWNAVQDLVAASGRAREAKL